MAGLDKQPEFPDGNFQSEVVKRFVVPEIDQDMNVRLYMSFIVEKDGSISNVKCERDPGFGLCLAAEKSLKEITAKWKPGIKNGLPVRVSYVSPIAINIRGNTLQPKGETNN